MALAAPIVDPWYRAQAAGYEAWYDVRSAGRQFGRRHPGLSRVGSALKSYSRTSLHAAGMRDVKFALGLSPESGMVKGIGIFGRALGIGFTAFAAYRGYQEGGAWGAVKETGIHLLSMYAFGWALRAAGITAGAVLPAAALAGTAAAAGLGIVGGLADRNPLKVLARPYVREHMRKHAKLEMGRPVLDQFGTVATMRQRSMMAMQRSKINGRSALGNEATLMYQPYFR